MISTIKAESLSPLKLAFLGDAVFELYIRNKLLAECNKPVGDLNTAKIKLVCCKGQSEFLKKILKLLTPEELSIYKRGRNAYLKQFPKKVSRIIYHRATGLEALFGYWYLMGQKDRIEQIIKLL